jgi:hypothetical protein
MFSMKKLSSWMLYKHDAMSSLIYKCQSNGAKVLCSAKVSMHERIFVELGVSFSDKAISFLKPVQI